ncbi:MAG: signal recognition particle-docking protein FtsY [Chitinispirillia bacterium]|nr:signal recognition particle-docking protein FtsY [Chitinispirillia bacterium]MCL2241976.1 signal recognition particle-docking protein FtsY [Chitinispirillia bacterium]
MGFFDRLRDGLSKTRSQITAIVKTGAALDEEFFETLSEALIAADVGIDLVDRIFDDFREEIKRRGIRARAEAYALIKEMLAGDLTVTKAMEDFPPKPWVVLVVGVNGVGKTTTIGKLAQELRQAGKKVMLGAADTFRAGAIEQLKIWAGRTGSDFVAQHEGADAASVAFDAMEAARSRGADVLILDTAGRLHVKVNLMNELEKIQRVIRRNTPHAPNEILLVVDATTGQNAMKQAVVFNEVVKLTGLVITKLDGTAKGGIAIALTRRFNIPIRKIGVGEGIDDLQDFDPKAYVEAMLGSME